MPKYWERNILTNLKIFYKSLKKSFSETSSKSNITIKDLSVMFKPFQFANIVFYQCYFLQQIFHS